MTRRNEVLQRLRSLIESDRYPPGTIEAAVRTLDQPVDDRRIGHLMAEFLKHRTLADV